MRIDVIGIGPGGAEFLTPQAKHAIEQSEVVVGYHLYVELIEHLTTGKTVLSTSMKQEVKRCQLALEQALLGKRVAFVCSGDAGVYGMAGVMNEVAEAYPQVEIHTIAGITAACSGAAVLGAPLIHDFAVISLSDLLTPWETIAKRLSLSAEADFVLCLYNPKSKKRADYLEKAVKLVGKHRAPNTPCGFVQNIGRDGEKATLCTLAELPQRETIDMFTTVFIGNSQTKIINGKLVTPRGYRDV